MSKPTLTITLDVDLSNPGQFLACCGLLELASRMDASSFGWFNDSCFNVACTKHAELLSTLCDCKISPRKLDHTEFLARQSAGKAPASSNTINPIVFGAPFHLEIDWWLKPSPNRAFKTWSGKAQVPHDILTGVQRWTADCLRSATFTIDELLHRPGTLDRQPFCYSSAKSRHALDVGFSINDSPLTLSHYPLVELLVFVALQRFRPAPRGEWFGYITWPCPLPVNLAACAMIPGLCSLGGHHFEFQVIDRDDHDHRQFSYARRRQHE